MPLFLNGSGDKSETFTKCTKRTISTKEGNVSHPITI